MAKKNRPGSKTKPTHSPPKPVKTEPSRLERFFRGRRVVATVILLLGLFAAQAITSMAVKSPTSDEVADLPSGYTHLKLRDYRMFPEHPPLVKILAALPLLPMHLDMRTEDSLWKNQGGGNNNWDYGKHFSFDWNKEAADEMFFRGRLVVVLLGLALGVLVFFWTRSIFGNAAGALALFLYAFSPNILAHTRLVTTDLGMALFSLLALWCFDRAIRRITPLRVAAAGITLGLALLTKFSALVLPIVFVIILLIRALDGKQMKGKISREFVLNTRGGKTAATAGVLYVVLLIAFGMIWAGYGFRFRAFNDTQIDDFTGYYLKPCESEFSEWMYETGLKNRLLPQAYLRGFIYNVRNNEKADHISYLEGKTKLGPWPTYYLMTFIFKTPIATMLFFAAGLIFAFRQGAEKRRRLTAPVVFAVVYLVVLVSGNLNMGHRLALPVLPVILIFAGGAISGTRQAGRRAAVTATIILAVFTAWYAAEAAFIYPDYLAYFNRFAGGPDNGYRHLSDSNIDWGQDTGRIKQYVEKHGIREPYLCLFTNALPQYFEFQHKWIYYNRTFRPGSKEPDRIRKGEYLFISVNFWNDCFRSPRIRRTFPLLQFRQFHGDKYFEQVGDIGHSILVLRAKKEVDLLRHARTRR